MVLIPEILTFDESEFCHESIYLDGLANSGTFLLANNKIICICIWRSLLCFLTGWQEEAQSRHSLSLYLTEFLSPHLTVHSATLWRSGLKWDPACYCTSFVPVMLSGAHFGALFVVCQFLTVRDRSEAIPLNLQFKLGPLQPDYKSTFRALRSSLQWMVDISNHSAVNPNVR